MKSFTYNDMNFAVEKSTNGWDISYQTSAVATAAFVGTGLFQGMPENEVEAKAKSLVKSIFPVGIKIVGPDTAHPTMIGDLRLVGPDTVHPNFIYWDKQSSSSPKIIG